LTETPPAPEPVPVPEGGPLTHVEAWFAKHVFPGIADIRIKSENALIAVTKAAPVLEKVARVLEASVKAGTLPAEIVADAEAVASEAASVAAELAAFV
jgi:hypothetical protein